MKQSEENTLALSAADQLACIERLAEAIRAQPEFIAFWGTSRRVYTDPDAVCSRDELPIRLYESRKRHQPVDDGFCSRPSVQAYVHAEGSLRELLKGVEQTVSRRAGIEFTGPVAPTLNHAAPAALPADLLAAAEELGDMLAGHPALRAYRQSATALAADAAATDLDLRFVTLQHRLKARQRAMLDMRPADVAAFQELRQAVLANPLIEERDRTLEEARRYLAQVAASLSHKLALDFASMAQG